MAQRLSQGPLQVSSLDLESVNVMLKRIRQELDELRGLRGEVKILEKISVPTAINVTQQTVPSAITPPPITVNNQPLNHGSLGGLGNDDHKQYALLTGRAGGQVLVGGPGSGDDLTLQSGGKVNFEGAIDLKSAVQLSGDITPVQLTANVNDYNLSGMSISSVFRLSSDASRNITGIAGGTDGRIVILHNVGSNDIVLVDESALSLAPNRFALKENITISADVAVMIQYDSTATRWRALAVGAAGISGSGANKQVTFWTGTPATLTGDTRLQIDFPNSLQSTLTLTTTTAAGSTTSFQLKNAGDANWTLQTNGTSGDFILNNENGVGSALRGDWNLGIALEARLRFSGVLSPAQITADQNDYNPTGFAQVSFLRLSSDASRNITGLVPGTVPQGRIVTIHNIGSFNIVLVDESASSTAANRFALTANLTLAPDQCTTLQYDNTSLRWRVIGADGAAAASTAYTPANLNDWDGLADPGDIADALDQLARNEAREDAGQHNPVWEELLSDDCVLGTRAVSARVRKSAAQTLTSGVVTTITWDVEDFDTDSIHDNVTNNSRLTAPFAGKYLCQAGIEYAVSATGDRICRLRHQGTTIFAEQFFASGGSGSVIANASGIYYFNTGEYFEVQGFQDSGGNLNVNSAVRCFAAMTYLGQ